MAWSLSLVVMLVLIRTAQNRHTSEIAYWTVSGPPCRQVTRADIRRLPRSLDQTFLFERGRFSRISGEAFCSGLTRSAGLRTTHDDVCQFNSPRALAVTSGARTVFYDIPDTRPATVTIGSAGAQRCVVNARFRGD